MCTVWPSHSKWPNRAMNLHQILHESWTFLCGNCLDDSEGCSYGQLVIGSIITTMCLLIHHDSCSVFWQNIKSPRWLSLLYSLNLAPCDFLLSPKLKSLMKGERFLITDETPENMIGQLIMNGKTVKSQGAYFESDLGIIVLCKMFLVSCIFFNKCLYFLYYMAGYLLGRLHIHVMK